MRLRPEASAPPVLPNRSAMRTRTWRRRRRVLRHSCAQPNKHKRMPSLLIGMIYGVSFPLEAGPELAREPKPTYRPRNGRPTGLFRIARQPSAIMPASLARADGRGSRYTTHRRHRLRPRIKAVCAASRAAHTPDSTALLKFFRVAKTPWVYTVLCGKTGNRNPG